MLEQSHLATRQVERESKRIGLCAPVSLHMSAVGVLSIIGTLALKGRNVAEETLPIEVNDSNDFPVRA
jgi:hypothetical protein